MANYISDPDLLSQLNASGAPAPAPAAAPAAQSPLDRALAAEGLSDHPVAQIARSVYRQESASGANTKTSNAGAVGGMQIKPATFADVADPGWDINNPVDNARAGIRYLKQGYDASGGDPTLTAVHYYGGPGGMLKAAQGVAVADPKNPGAPNTLQYAQQVTGRLPQQDTQPAAASPAPDASGKQYVQDPALLASLNAPAPAAPSRLAVTGQSVLQALRDPIDNLAQMAAHAAQGLRSNITAAVPERMRPDVLATTGDPITAANDALAAKTGLVAPLPAGGIDQQIQQNEQAYQAQRAAVGSSGFDTVRTIGDIANPINWLATSQISKVPAALNLVGKARTIANVAASALSGVASNVLDHPITDGGAGDYWAQKANQAKEGAVGGAIAYPVGGAIARLVSPNASTNASLQLLKSEGVQPTIGQTLGGVWNNVEQKATAVPILGDMIARARRGAVDQFDSAAINRALAPIGEEVDGTGFDAIKAAGDKLSAAYDTALNRVQSVALDPQFQTQLTQLRGMAQNLVPDMARKFDKTLNDIVLGRAGPQGVLLGPTYKGVDSELGQVASRFGKSSLASEQEYGEAVGQLRNLLRQQMARTNPQAAQELANADAGWANLVRVEGAAKAGLNDSGRFTPAQLNRSIAGADDSVRRRAVSRGEALMQDLSDAGQSVLGNKVPDSGTAGRLLLNAGALGSAALHPAIPIGLGIGGLAYTGPIQSALRAAVSSRPQGAQAVAQTIRDSAHLLAPVGGALALEAGP